MSDRYRSPNCLTGAHQACPHLGTTCECPCHVTGAAYTTERVPVPTLTVPNPRFEEHVARRAWDLCRNAEPHRDPDHMLLHTSEARRQLIEQWMGQDDRPESEVA